MVKSYCSDTILKKVYRINTYEKVVKIMFRKLQIKQQKDITTYLLEWPESKILKKLNASKNIK